MQFLKNHPVVITFIVAVALLLTLSGKRPETKPAASPSPEPPPNLSILLKQIPQAGLTHLFVQNLDSKNGGQLSQEVFTLRQEGKGAAIAHYTSSSPHYLPSNAISQPQADGKMLDTAKQQELKGWMQERLESRLRQLDKALFNKTGTGLYSAFQVVNNHRDDTPELAEKLRPWRLTQTPRTTAKNDSTPPEVENQLQLQLHLPETAYENLESFAKRLAAEFRQRTSSP